MIQRFRGYFSGETYQARAFRGTALTIGSMGSQNLIRLGSNLILTRLLFPEAFGLMALVQVILAGAAMFSDVGLHAAIVQNPRGRDPAFLNTAWTMQIARGVILGVVILLLANPLAEFYEAPQLAPLLYAAAAIPVIQGLNSTKMPLADREIQYGRVIALNIGSQAIGALVMIGLAVVMESVWALLVGSFVSAILVAVLSHLYLKGEPNQLAFEREAAVSLFVFGRFIFFATIAAFFINNGDRAILGKFVSLDDLAIFNIGFFLASAPLLVATELGDKVMFPLYARRPPAESETNRRKINAARMGLSAIMITALASLALVGDWVVRFLYDQRYESAGPILVAIALAGMPLVLTQTYHKMPLAYGNSGRFAIFVVGRALIQVGVLLAVVPTFGLWGAAMTPGVTTLISYPLLVWVIAPFKGWDPWHDVLFALISTALIAALVWYHSGILTPVLMAF